MSTWTGGVYRFRATNGDLKPIAALPTAANFVCRTVGQTTHPVVACHPECSSQDATLAGGLTGKNGPGPFQVRCIG